MNTYTSPGAGAVGGAALAVTGAGTSTQVLLIAGALMIAGSMLLMAFAAKRRRADRAATRR